MLPSASCLRISRIEPARAVALLSDQPSLFNFQMLRDRRAADRQTLGDRRDRPRCGEDALKNEPPCRIGERS